MTTETFSRDISAEKAISPRRENRGFLDGLHPAAATAFFVCIIALTMLLGASPAGTAVSFAGAVLLFGLRKGIHSLVNILKIIFILSLLTTLTNLFVSRRGDTVLFFVNGAAVTAESAASGFFTGVLIGAVGIWFSIFGDVVTSDKVFFLFGKKTPKIALLFSMTVGFVPKIIKRYSDISKARRGFEGENTRDSQEKILNKVKERLAILSVLVTLSLERAMDTADSMRARGYGTAGRTCAAEYRFSVRDFTVMLLTLVSFTVSVILIAAGVSQGGYYPIISTPSGKDWALFFTAAFLAGIPVVAEVRENLLWHTLNSKK